MVPGGVAERSAESTTPARRPRRRRGKPLRVLARLFGRMFQGLALLALTLAALALGWLKSEDFQVLATHRAEQMIETALGERATLTRVSVEFWPPGIQIEGFHVFSGETDETILSAERIRVPIALTWTGPRMGLVTLQRPVVHLHVDSTGKLVEFQNRVRTGQRLTRLPWNGLRVLDGDLSIEHPAAGVEITGLTVVPRRGTVSDISAELALTAYEPGPAPEGERRSITQTSDVSWSAVQLGPTEIVVPALALDGSVLDLAGSVVFPLAGELDIALNGALSLDELTPLFQPPRAGHGEVGFSVVVTGPPEDPRARVTARGERLGLDMPGKFTPVLAYDLDTLALNALVHRGGVEIEQLLAPWAGGTIVATGHLTPDQQLENGRVTAEGVTLAPLLRAFGAAPNPWVDLVGNGAVEWAGTLSPLHLEGTFDLGVLDLHVADRPIDVATADNWLLDIPFAHATGTLVLERTHVLLDCLSVVSPRNEGTAQIDLGLLARGPLDLRFQLHRADLEDFAPLSNVRLKGRGSIEGVIQGPFNALAFEGSGDIAGFEALGIYYADRLVADLRSPHMRSIELENANATLGATTYGGRYAIDFSRKDPVELARGGAPVRSTVTMSTTIEVTKGRVEDLVNMFVDLDGLKGDLTGTMTLDGPLFDLSGEAHLALRDAEIYKERFPTGTAHGYMDRGVFTLDDLRLRRDEGRAGLTLRGTVERDWQLDMELIADGLELAKLDRLTTAAAQRVSGKLGAISRIRNTLYDPSPDGRIWVTDLRYGGVPAGDSLIFFDSENGVASYQGDLLGRTARVEGTLGLWDQQPYELRAKLSRVPAHLLYPVAADGSQITAVATGDLSMSGHFGPVWSPVSLRANLTQVNVEYDAHRLRNETPWNVALDDGQFSIQGFNLAGGKTAVELSGSGPTPMELDGGGTIDLDLLRAVLPGLQKSIGSANVTISARGTKPDVDALIDVKVAAPLFRHESAPLSFEDSRMHVQVARDSIEVLTLTGGVGGGTFKGSGRIESHEWWPTRWDLSLDVNDASVQWIDTLPPAVGDGHFRFDGPSDSLLLSGDVNVTEMIWVDRIDWEDYVVEFRSWMLVDPASVSNEPPMFNFDVGITADQTIELRNNLAEANASADLRITGDTVRPGLLGSVTVQDDGLAYLQDREFRVKRGNLLFDDPWTWDPQLDISLVTDVTSRDQRYSVEYQVMGPFSNWRTVSHSDPWLPQSDVNALLWFGVTMDDLQEMGALPYALALGVGNLLVTDLIVSGQAGVSQNFPDFFPDRIDVATGINARGQYSPDPRLVLEKRIEELGGVDLTWEMNVTRPQDNYATARVRIGGGWSLSAWYATLQRDRELPIGGAYGADLLVRWEFE
jgi:TamB, inner membrane protein subunit of TAM complex